MKKYNIFKVLLLVLAAAIIVSFLIPSSTIGYYTSGIEKGTINPINFVDSISNGLTSFSVFISAFIFILSISYSSSRRGCEKVGNSKKWLWTGENRAKVLRKLMWRNCGECGKLNFVHRAVENSV